MRVIKGVCYTSPQNVSRQHELSSSRSKCTYFDTRGHIVGVGAGVHAQDPHVFAVTALCENCGQRLIIYNIGFPTRVHYHDSWRELQDESELYDNYVIGEEPTICP